MATELLSLGYVISVIADRVYALPARRCLMFCDAAGPTFFQSDTVAFTVSVAVTLANGQAELAGGFLKMTSAGPQNIMLKALS